MGGLESKRQNHHSLLALLYCRASTRCVFPGHLKRDIPEVPEVNPQLHAVAFDDSLDSKAVTTREHGIVGCGVYSTNKGSRSDTPIQ